MTNYEVESTIIGTAVVFAVLVGFIIFLLVKVHQQEKKHRKEMEKYQGRDTHESS